MLSRLDIRWRIAIMLCVITTINYLDRQALSIAAPSLMKEFSISNTQYGWITSAFLFTYALGQLLSGPGHQKRIQPGRRGMEYRGNASCSGPRICELF